MAQCPSCGSENRAEARFCDACGSPLEAQPTHARTEERKVVTVLFCDLVGFTAASETADPEDVRATLRPYHELLRERIEAFGGTVEKFVGDAVMAVFGAPVAHEDDAERAIRAGLAILERLQGLGEADPEQALSVRIGINTGEALVALDARPEQGEGFVTGDVVNTAARIESAAPVGGVAVGEATYRATERVFEWGELAPVQAKGKAEPLRLWQPLAARARFGTDVIRTTSTPLVGRELDLLQLRTLLEKSFREPSVQLVTISGEPGVGKSRLVAELGAHVDALPELVRWRQGRCLPYGEGIAFWALGEIVKAQAGIYESDAPAVAADKLEQALPQVTEAAWLKARLLPLLGIDSGTPVSRDESFTAWRRFLESIAEREPAVLVFEDLHWADEALLDFLEHLADWAQGVALLVVCTARPELYERRPSWGAGLRNASTIALAPLTEGETAALVSHLLDHAVLPVETQQAVLERAGGNPLYAEEFVRMLRDQQLLDERGGLRASDVPFPDTLHALIAARLDTLPADAKALLQDAAVIGKVFWTGAVAAMGDRDVAAVATAVHELARKELVRPSRQSSMEGEQEVGFWHSMVRDVAYAQIPRSLRAVKHVAAADWIEAKAGERLEDLSDVLAYHTGEAIALAEAAGDTALASTMAPAARRYALLAGERALGLDARRAAQLLERALELTPEDDDAHPTVLLRFAGAAHQLGRLEDAVAAAERAVAAYRDRNDPVRTGEALTMVSLTGLRHSQAGDVRPVQDAIELLETVPPSPQLVAAYGQLAGELLVDGAYPKALEASERALALADELDLPVPGRALGFHGAALMNTGDAERGLEEMAEARQRLEAAGHGRDAAIVHHNYAVNRWVLEGLAAALAGLEEAQVFARTRGLREFASSSVATTIARLVDAGRLREALDVARRVEPEVEAGVFNPVARCEYQGALALALTELGDRERAEDAARKAYELAKSAARPHGALGLVLAGPVALRVASGLDRPVELLRTIADWEDAATSEEVAGRLPRLVRLALELGEPDLAGRMASVSATLPLPLFEHAMIASRAAVAETEGEHDGAARLYADAALRWEGFGARLEQAYAALGEARCLAELDDRRAEERARDARALFAAMDARPRVADCDALLRVVLAPGA